MNIVLMIQENKALLFMYRKIASILKIFPDEFQFKVHLN